MKTGRRKSILYEIGNYNYLGECKDKAERSRPGRVIPVQLTSQEIHEIDEMKGEHESRASFIRRVIKKLLSEDNIDK